jgi:hypothetical protein
MCRRIMLDIHVLRGSSTIRRHVTTDPAAPPHDPRQPPTIVIADLMHMQATVTGPLCGIKTASQTTLLTNRCRVNAACYGSTG